MGKILEAAGSIFIVGLIVAIAWIFTLLCLPMIIFDNLRPAHRNRKR